MAVTTQRTLPAQFVEDLGKDLATQVVAQSGVPVVSTGLAGISQQAGESAADFQARQQAAQQFTTRQQSLAGLAPQVAQQDALQQRAESIAEAQAGTTGLVAFQPFLTQAQQQAQLAGGLGTIVDWNCAGYPPIIPVTCPANLSNCSCGKNVACLAASLCASRLA